MGSKKYIRPSWDEYFMKIKDAVSGRATCNRGRTAVVVVKDRIVLVTGYVGSPSGIAHCDDVGHLMKKVVHEDETISNHCVRTIHAEMNAIALAAKKGISIDGATMYMGMSPCYNCAKVLINTGIKRIVCNNLYHRGKEALEILKKAGVEVTVLNDEVEDYENQ